MNRSFSLLAGAVVALSTTAVSAQPDATYDIEIAFPERTFERPVDVQHPGDGSNRLFVVEQDGVIRVFTPMGSAGATAFLDIRERVLTVGNEMGLLGLAFAPDFSESGHFFVYYTTLMDERRYGRLSRFTTVGGLGDPGSEVIVLEVQQPWANHNGGGVAFGPDGYLYLGLGDGGSAGDPRGNGQNRKTLLGSILRIDVRTLPYAIPADNPFAGNERGYREEIFAYGLRNPWRFSFDSETGWLWVGDVGQVTWEEVNRVESGGNYGWDCREGYRAYQPARERTRTCAGMTDFAPPAWVYGRDAGQSITGGYVYRGERFPELVGWYIYADYVSGRIWALYYDGQRAQNRELVDTDIFISSFGVDADGELLLCEHNPGGETTHIYRLTKTEEEDNRE